MNTHFIKVVLSIFMLLSLTSCKESGEEKKTQSAPTDNRHQHHDHKQSHEHAEHNAPATIVKQAGDVQVSFDISTMSAHHKMMQDMKMNMNHDSKSSHYVMVTLMDQDKNLLKDIPIKVKAVGPDGKSLGDESGMGMEVMSGNGMYHYGHGFDFASPGKYQILVMFKHGDKVLSTGTEWEKK